MLDEKQGFWKSVLQGGSVFSSPTLSYSKANRYTKEAVILLIVFGYLSIAVIGHLLDRFDFAVLQIVPFLASIYCLWLVKTLQARTKNQIKWGYITAYFMLVVALYSSLYYLNQIIPLIIRLLLAFMWFDLGNYFRKAIKQ